MFHGTIQQECYWSFEDHVAVVVEDELVVGVDEREPFWFVVVVVVVDRKPQPVEIDVSHFWIDDTEFQTFVGSFRFRVPCLRGAR